MEATKICFIIAPIGEPGSDIRKRSDQVLNFIIKPIVEKLGYEPIRADKISEPGIITSQVIQQIIDADLVIADLSGHNPNVFYELAIRHMIRKPLIHMINKGENIPFDVVTQRTIPFDVHDLNSVDSAKSDLNKQINTILEKGIEEIENPISISIDLKHLRKSDDPTQRSLAEILANLAFLRTSIKQMQIDIDKLVPPLSFTTRSAERYADINDIMKYINMKRKEGYDEETTRKILNLIIDNNKDNDDKLTNE
jgi:hypothetical protein